MTILLESAIRVTLIAAIIAMVLWIMRIKTAAVLYAVWASLVILMMLLPAWVAWGPRASIPVLAPQVTGSPAQVNIVRSPSHAGVTAAPSNPVREDGGFAWRESAIPGIYLLGAGLLLLRLAIGTVRASRLKSASCVVPVTVGLLRPRIILPESSRNWSQAQMEAVLLHEREHIRRRDPLFQWIALMNRAIFWFHPLAWWLERKLSGLAEEVCDTAVLAQGHDPREYSKYLLDLAKSVRRAGSRIEVVGMAMPGAFLPQRIKNILSGVPVPRTSRMRIACTLAVCAIVALILVAGTLVHAQSSGVQFEVASIRPSNPNAGGGGNGKSKDGGGGGLRPSLDHGRFNFSSTLFGLIIRAYGAMGCNEGKSDCALISGGPDWLTKDRFDIQAKMPDGSPDYTFLQFLRGEAPQLELMLQAMLAERFNLKVHRETKQLPVYALAVVKNGKLRTATGEMIQLKDGTSVRNRSLLWTPAPLPDGSRSDHLIRMFVRDQSMRELVDTLSRLMDRPVLDRTGLKGNFDITIDYERNLDGGDTPGSDITGPAMFTAFQEQLGLKFESTRAPVEVLVIDHAEKPSAN